MQQIAAAGAPPTRPNPIPGKATTTPAPLSLVRRSHRGPATSLNVNLNGVVSFQKGIKFDYQGQDRGIKLKVFQDNNNTLFHSSGWEWAQ